MSIHEVLQWLQALLFTGLAIAGLRSWREHRTAPAAYVAAAFAVLGIVTLTQRVAGAVGNDLPEPITTLTATVLISFPWLLAAFAWSFTGRLPGWLRAAAVATAVLALLAFVVPYDTEPDGWQAQSYVATVLAVWSVLSTAAAVHLWRAGRGQRVIGARTRLLALGALVLAGTLLLAASPVVGGRTSETIIGLLAIASALLFAAGFAPPPPLRFYWRQLPARRMHQMQTALVAAVTPADVAAAVVPVLADSFGGGALCTGPAHHIVARSGLSDADADRIQDAIRSGTAADLAGVQVLAADPWHLAVHTSPYAPIFGDDERTLLERFGLQLRLAMQRAELFVAHGAAREELEEASRDLQAMLVGLAHDLRSPAVTISTYAALLPDADDDDRDQMIAGLQDGSAYLDRLVDGLVSLSRIGRNDGEPEPVELSSVVVGVARRLSANHPGLRIIAEDDLPTVCVDRLRIEQVVDNLLGNAAKHGGRDDLTVEVSWEPVADGGGTLTFADDGQGIGAVGHEDVFTLFRRGATSAAGSGVGLGLVRRIIENHGGRIHLAPSERGARFEIHLPQEVLVTAPTRPAHGAVDAGQRWTI